MQQSRANSAFVFLFVRVDLVEAILAEVLPMIVGGTICLYGQGALCFVEEDFEEYILVLGAAAVEDELQVGTHGEYAAAPPAFGLELVEVIGREIITINAYQTYQWQEYRLVAEAELSTWTV